MNFFFLAHSNYVDPYGEDILKRFTEKGIPTFLLGMATVFVVLCIIWGALEVFRYVFYTLPNKKAKAEADNNPAPAEAVSAEEPVTEEADEGEIVAAIIAAVTAMRESDEVASPTGFRVVSFRKK